MEKDINAIKLRRRVALVALLVTTLSQKIFQGEWDDSLPATTMAQYQNEALEDYRPNTDKIYMARCENEQDRLLED